MTTPKPAPPESITDGEYVPVCPTCRGAVRRDLRGDPLDWRCDLHGPVTPTWEAALLFPIRPAD